MTSEPLGNFFRKNTIFVVDMKKWSTDTREMMLNCLELDFQARTSHRKIFPGWHNLAFLMNFSFFWLFGNMTWWFFIFIDIPMVFLLSPQKVVWYVFHKPQWICTSSLPSWTLTGYIYDKSFPPHIILPVLAVSQVSHLEHSPQFWSRACLPAAPVLCSTFRGNFNNC